MLLQDIRYAAADLPGTHGALGLAGAFLITPVIGTILHDVSPTDPASFAGVAAFLTAVAILASYLPARRALEVDPIVALRGTD